jgi:hypothetical protein
MAAAGIQSAALQKKRQGVAGVRLRRCASIARQALLQGTPPAAEKSNTISGQSTMFGQGSPTFARAAAARASMTTARRALRWAVCARRGWRTALLLFLACAVWCGNREPLRAQEARQTRPVRLRIAWGGGDEARRWSGQISISDGTLSSMELLGMEADAAAAVWRQENVVHISALRPHRFDGIDVTASASEEARIVVELTAEGLAEPVVTELPIADVIRQPVRRPLDDRNNVVLIHRSPGDGMRIEAQREGLIFAPGEPFPFILRPTVPGLKPGTTVDVTTTIAPAEGGAPLWSDVQQRLNVPPSGELSVTIDAAAPENEGVYTVRLQLRHPPGFGREFLPLGGGQMLGERSFQIVVLNQRPDAPDGELSWQTVLESDPANPSLLQKLPRRLPGVPQRPLGSIRAGTVELPLGRFVELPPAAAGSEPHWQAYPLAIERPGVAHMIEIEYPADREQHLGLSIVEPNAAGRVVPIGRDSGAYVDGLGRAERNERHTHRFVFWPRTEGPLLLVTNLHPTGPAYFGRIRVLRASGPLGGNPGERPRPADERPVLAYLSRPLAPESFGAAERLDPASRQSVEDWQTHYQAASRLAEFLPFGEYNGAVVSVLADGGATFPSNRLLSTPVYNTGRMVDGTNDLPPSDALELTLRIFDRQRLSLIPAIQLAAPLPELENLRRLADPQSTGIEWVGPDGRTWLEANNAGQGLAPYYNLLNERVQRILLELAAELVDRYGHHESLGGLAVQLSGDGYGQLPGPSWGLDDATIAQFERDTRIQIANDDGPQRFAVREDALSGENAEAWRRWRAARVSQFYRRLAALVQASRSDRRLLITTEDAFTSRRSQAQVQPNLLTKVRFDLRLLELGIDRESLEKTPGLVVCSAHYVAPSWPLADRAIDMTLNEASWKEGMREVLGDSAARLFYHRPVRARLTSFDARSPWPSSAWLVSYSAASAAAARKPLAHSLANHELELILDGGELLPMGQEDALRRAHLAARKLPRGAEAAVVRQQPVTIKIYSAPDGTMLLAVNESPWRAEAQVTLELPNGAKLECLTSDAAIQNAPPAVLRTLDAGTQEWALSLEPYDVQLFRLTAGDVRVARLEAQISDAAKEELKAQLTELVDRDLTKRSVYRRLANPEFEPVEGIGPVPGWQLAPGEGAAAELDARNPHGGKTCLYFRGSGPLATMQSQPFPTPPTGQLFLTVHLKGENFDPVTELRLVLEVEREGASYRQLAVIGGPAARQSLSDQWQHCGFFVRDLPLDSQSQMRVKFEMLGPGDVWIDDVVLYDLLFPFPQNEYKYSLAENKELVILVTAAQLAVEGGQVADAVRLLEGYWSRFLIAHTPRVELSVARNPAEPAPTPPPETPMEDSPPSVPIWKRLLPSSWR